MRILLLDNYDSFTYNLQHYVAMHGITCDVIRNDADINPLLTAYDGVVLSPGPQSPAKAGGLMQAVDLCVQQHIPLLGICLGHQAIGMHFGARLVKAAVPMHGKTAWISHNQHAMFSGIPSPFQVRRYHSLILENIENTTLQTTAVCQGEIMAVAHPQLPVWGVQYHPEAILTQYGKEFVSNWLAQVKKY